MSSRKNVKPTPGDRGEQPDVEDLQGRDRPSAEQVRTEIMRTVRRLGTRGCAERMAQEFGDDPRPAVDRMRWARHVVADVFAAPQSRAHALAA